MPQPIRMTLAVTSVLAAFLADPGEPRYGLDLMRATNQPSGTLYPILLRLQRAGWVVAEWEEIDAAAASRPARRYYRLTPDGLAAARLELAELYQQLHQARTGTGRARPALEFGQ